MAQNNHTFTVLGHYRIITQILGREPTMSEFCKYSDYSRHGYHLLRRTHPQCGKLPQTRAEDELMKQLYVVLKNKYE